MSRIKCSTSECEGVVGSPSKLLYCIAVPKSSQESKLIREK